MPIAAGQPGLKSAICHKLAQCLSSAGFFLKTAKFFNGRVRTCYRFATTEEGYCLL